jgi:hypothetical protein
MIYHFVDFSRHTSIRLALSLLIDYKFISQRFILEEI